MNIKKLHKINFKGKIIEIEELENGKFKMPEFIKNWKNYHSGVAPLKQAMETLLIFRKPLKTGAYIDDIMELENQGCDDQISPCCLDIDGNRVEYENENDIIPQLRQDKRNVNAGNMYRGNSLLDSKTKATIGGSVEGRYPVQLFIDDDCAKVIDNQSGTLHSGALKEGSLQGTTKDIYGKYSGVKGKAFESSDGGASRILNHCQYDEAELNGQDLVYYCPKVSKFERESMIGNINTPDKDVKDINQQFNVGLVPRRKTEKYAGCSSSCSICGKMFLSGGENGNPCTCDESVYGSKADRMVNPTFKNPHPSLKPLKLIYHFAKLFKLPEHIDQKVYIPFSGTYSEIIGFLGAGYNPDNIYGVEVNADYIEIGKARLKFWLEHNYFFKESKIDYNKAKDKVNKVKKIKSKIKPGMIDCKFKF